MLGTVWMEIAAKEDAAIVSGLNKESAKEQVPEIQVIFEDQTGEAEVSSIL